MLRVCGKVLHKDVNMCVSAEAWYEVHMMDRHKGINEIRYYKVTQVLNLKQVIVIC